MLRSAPVASIALVQEISQTVFYLVILRGSQRHADRASMYTHVLFYTAHFFLLFFWQTVQCLQLFFIF